jgi:uncharacterized protein
LNKIIGKPTMQIKKHKFSLRWPLIIFAAAIIAVIFINRLNNFSIDTDVVGSLPQNDPVLKDARYVIRHLPFQDRVVIDLSHQKTDKDILVEGAQYIEAELKKSGLFKNIGIDKLQEQFPGLIVHIVNNLPVMFTGAELDEKIKPLLTAQNIKHSLNENLRQLQSLEGIGQSEFIMKDPLGFKNIALAKLAGLAPSNNASIYKGKLLSLDEKHLLIVAELRASGTDIKEAAKINSQIDRIFGELNNKYKEFEFTLNPVGAYRAVLDNQTISKKDTEFAVTISTIVIAILLILGFPRPLIGLLALVPSIVGTVLAFVVYSLLHQSISALAIGFGGAIISFTVDYGITYLIFLDRPHETYGLQATKEVWSLGLLAMLTTAISFSFLFISGFPALAQIGEFAALGVICTYICVHAFFPVIFPKMPPAKRKGILPLNRLVSRLMNSEGKYKLIGAIIFCVIMLFFAKPQFRADLDTMNTVSKATLASEKLVKDKWGDFFTRIFLMSEADGINELHEKNDKLTSLLEKDMRSGIIKSAFLPSMIFPGKERTKDNFNAWKKFWSKERINNLRKNLAVSSKNAGFADNAFSDFIRTVQRKNYEWSAMPAEYHELFGIVNEDGKWSQFAMFETDKAYNADLFYSKYSDKVKFFDPDYFTKKLGSNLLSGFIRMALIVGIITIIVTILYLADLTLSLISILPTVFALICTFGTLKLLNQPLGIPAILVSVVVIGMGTDYGLYLVRAYQRYMDENNKSLKLIHMSVFLAFATTFAGFGVLALSSHSLLKSAGLCLALGIGYSFIGAVSIIPPLLKRAYAVKHQEEKYLVAGSKEHFRWVMKRYKHMEAYPRFFARFKIMCDPMFPKLAEFVNSFRNKSPKKIIDIGCGYGVPSAWLLALYPDAGVFAIEPDERRVLIASRAIGTRGVVITAGAPDMPSPKSKSDTVLLLDMIHYLNDKDLRVTLKWIRSNLIKKGTLIIRVTIPSRKKFPWERKIENIRIKILKTAAYFRTESELSRMIKAAGFTIKLIEPSGKNREETWIIAE